MGPDSHNCSIMRRRNATWVFLVSFLCGCDTTTLDGGATGGDDAGRAVDLQGLDCGAIKSGVTGWISGRRTCVVDADCARAVTRCGLDGNCGVYVNTQALDGLASMSAAWDAQACSAAIDCAACPTSQARPAACVLGVCEASQPRAIGDGCRADVDCEQQCLLDPAFSGGYCTEPQPAACMHGGTCPGGAACESVDVTANGQTTTEYVCLKVCATGGDCRQGYTCCPGWSHGPLRSVCYPGACP